jgi:hypothetical protein
MKKFYPLVLDDGGRNKSKRPAQSYDCTVRALAIVTELPYDEAYDILASDGRRCNDGFYIEKWLLMGMSLKKGDKFRGVFKKLDTTGVNPLNFIDYYPWGRFLLVNHNHVWAVVNKKHRDLVRVPQEKPLSSAWEYKLCS